MQQAVRGASPPLLAVGQLLLLLLEPQARVAGLLAAREWQLLLLLLHKKKGHELMRLACAAVQGGVVARCRKTSNCA
jgi:hypothetical protein